MYHEFDLDDIDTKAKPPVEEPDRQYYFIAKCREWVRAFKQRYGRLPESYVLNMGCQMNARDSEKLTAILEQAGFLQAKTEEADFVIYNTCTVRENANNKVYGHLGLLNAYKKKNPHMKIALCGCMMQEPTAVSTIKHRYSFVDLVFGTHNIYKFAELLDSSLHSDTMVVDVWEDTDRIVEELPAKRKYRFKSGVNIMFGCNNFCSYCIVPYVRGRERSRKPEEILKEIRFLAADGVKEVMLLGQNVNSYGKNLTDPLTFAQLLEKVEQIDGIERIRFMTSHPKDLSDDLIEAMRRSKKICNHLHLPLQSGSSRILNLMNRRYDKEHYLNLVDRIRKAVPDLAITTDIIVGFPGETEEDFLETMDVVKKVRFDSAFTFLYSKRTGTPAASMDEQIPEHIAKERFDRLLREVQAIAAQKADCLTGRTLPVLAEEINRQDASLLTGRLTNNSVVHFAGTKEMIGTIQQVYLKESRGFYYIGSLQ